MLKAITLDLIFTQRKEKARKKEVLLNTILQLRFTFLSRLMIIKETHLIISRLKKIQQGLNFIVRWVNPSNKD